MTPEFLYAVRNKKGEYFRAKGYDGYGTNWVNELHRARIYTREGPAKSIVTWYANNHPEYGIPELIKLVITKIEVVDQTKRVTKAQREKAIRKEQLRIERQRRAITEAERALKDATERLKKARGEM
jgi:hypothetical protein